MRIMACVQLHAKSDQPWSPSFFIASPSMIAIFSASCYRQSRGFSVEAQREAVRRYLVSHHGEQIAEFVAVESGKRSDRSQLAAKALAKRHARSLC